MVPKFRAWDKDSKVMRSWKDLILEKDGGDDFWLIGYKENACITSFDHDQTLMQSTGLKDKNGVEIFEGDVVEWLGHRGVVEFVLNNQQTMIIGAQGYITDLDYSTDFNTEVIGNIHENPKILGQANES